MSPNVHALPSLHATDCVGAHTPLEQALWAVGSGRITGRSDDEARRSVLRHLPFLHTDFAFAAWAEQFGLLGSMGLFGLFFGLLWWGLGFLVALLAIFFVFFLLRRKRA